jgi:hypothetical protein
MFCWIYKTDSGLRYKIINKGTGVKAEKGKMAFTIKETLPNGKALPF